ncbi:type VI-B CRISPR-associated RNA-guided ribonuclease Cas13b [Apibacter raozihei]|uniref:type VI-B CRISPR-associated RNA-guided ribonuclease Cas13b n=1 Tax=Apibacter raozihei TaxID=2500547 RepID=UPI000FE32CF2|nr:type VI-B CRISPR-associated RNA-guided ribonuclease Cas13b [Apibacter raozihei]
MKTLGALSSHNYNNKKYYFSGLLNTAQYNFNLALQEVNDRLGKKGKNPGKTMIKNIFDQKDSFSTQERAMYYLEEFFPWIFLVMKQSGINIPTEEQETKLHKEEIQLIQEHLISLYELLDDLRNEQTHYMHDPVIIPEEVSKMLDALLLQILKNTRKKCKDDEYRTFIVKKYQEEFQKEIKVQVKDRFGKEKEKIVTGEVKENYVINRCFRKWIQKEGEEETLRYSTVQEEQGKYVWSSSGFVFFLSLFLRRKELEDVMNHVPYFKDSRKLLFYLTRKTFSSYCFRDLRKSLRSDYSNDSLLMQMIEELYKCPGELYEVLLKEQKQEFIEDINEYYKDNPEFEGSANEAQVIHPVIRKRYQDKFPYFALRFIDEYFNFPTLRFQLVLGEYVTDRRTKELQGTALFTDRVISQRISYVGKLSEAEMNKKREGYTETGWKEYPNPYYKIENNRIPLYIEFSKNEELIFKEKKFKYNTLAKWENREIDKRTGEFNQVNKQRRITQLEEFKIDNPKKMKTPNVFLSIYELPALLHALLIEKKTEAEIEDIIKAKIKKQLTEIAEGRRNLSGLPKGIKKMRNCNSDFEKKKLISDIDNEIKKGEKILEEVQQWLNPVINKKGTGKQENNKPFFSNTYRGKYATWLAYDIKRFTGKDHIQNWKGYQFSELQTLLSLYTLRKEELKNFLEKDLQLTSHPFLKEALKAVNLEDFMGAYLRGRQFFLEKAKKQIGIKGVKKSIFQYFEERKYKIYSSNLDYWEELWKHPVNLDRGLFDERGTVYNKNKELNDLQNRAAWFSFAETNPKQQFYHFPRIYSDEDITKPVTDRYGKTKEKLILFKLSPQKGFMEQIPSDLKKKYQEDKGKVEHPEVQKEKKYEEKKHPGINAFIKNAYKNEQKIRRISRNDIFLYEMVKYMLNKISPATEFSSLDKVWLTRIEREKQATEAREQSFKEKGDTSENKIRQDYLLSFPITLTLFNDIIKEKVKIKDIGRFRKLEKDERVQTMISYYTSGLWKNDQPSLTIKELEAELESYHKIRLQEIFKEVHKLEKEIYEFTPEEDKSKLLARESFPKFKYYISFYFIPKEDQEVFNEIQFDKYKNLEQIPGRKPEYDPYYLLIFIRNKFAHNQLPAEPIYKTALTFLPNNFNTLAEYYHKLFILLNNKNYNN